jgi:hypothetical protein
MGKSHLLPASGFRAHGSPRRGWLGVVGRIGSGSGFRLHGSGFRLVRAALTAPTGRFSCIYLEK